MKKIELLKAKLSLVQGCLESQSAHTISLEKQMVRLEDKLDALLNHLGIFAVYHMASKGYWGFEERQEDRDARKETK